MASKKIERPAGAVGPRKPRRWFQLDTWDPFEKSVSDLLDTLREQRLYKRSIVDGVRLVSDLRSGNLDVLFELFPWVEREIIRRAEITQPALSEFQQMMLEQQQLLIQQMSNGAFIQQYPDVMPIGVQNTALLVEVQSNVDPLDSLSDLLDSF